MNGKKQNNSVISTPIVDFVKAYSESNTIRFHMPGHKGQKLLGPEAMDITEISGADSLYDASGIIAESEENASRLFGSKKTVYSAEGSSLAIKTMIGLADRMKRNRKRRLRLLAFRNVHRAFVEGMALVDGEAIWVTEESGNEQLYSSSISISELHRAYSEAREEVDGIFVTTPDYLGNGVNLSEIGAFAREHGLLLLVDHAHGAYLRFVDGYVHPLDVGATFVAESAHKTLPVLTGGAYLHAGESVPDELLPQMKKVMELFGSTSPSYLILESLDACNRVLGESFREQLRLTVDEVLKTKETLREIGYSVAKNEPLKITFEVFGEGRRLSELLRTHGIECEYADGDYVVLMVSPWNTKNELGKLVSVLRGASESCSGKALPRLPLPKCRRTIREAVMGLWETVLVKDSVGRICGNCCVSCPPAIPIVVPGEEITEEAVEWLSYYGYETIDVVSDANEE